MSDSGPGTPHPDGYRNNPYPDGYVPPTTDFLPPGERRPRSGARPAVIVTIGVVLGVAVLVGLAGLVLGGAGDGDHAAAGDADTSVPAATGTPTATTAPTATGSPTRTTGSTSEPAAAALPRPTTPVSRPWKRPGSDFGALTDIQRRGDDLELVFNRQQFLNASIGGPQWTAWVAEHGQPENDYVIIDENPRLRVFTVDGDALLSVTGDLIGEGGAGVSDRTLDADEFYTAVRSALDGAYRDGLPVWLFHSTTSLSSPVIGVQQQYLP